ncbi:MAG: acetyl-CoA carboxylase biotin carboxylase subunit [Rhodospirillaceae bacterium]|nr:acetyl-CoA carboxylase biotin carboxylase subunit [Rhodospirillaceae bacterium]
MSINKILIANRGEIACRIMRTCKALGIATVAVYSDADAEAMHVAMADEAIPIGLAPAAKSYLVQENLLRAAMDSGADAVHPGYGFLAENPRFAEAVEAAGLAWIGPRAKTIEDMGDKERARDIAKASHVTILPGSPRFPMGDLSGVERAAEVVGYPLLVKAAAGGGGIGMRMVENAETLRTQVESTQTQAQRSFGDGTVYLETFIPNARHIEVQVFGFGDGDGVHLYDRDCSVQRRFQKIIEEAPAASIPEGERRAMRDAALELVRHERYRGAGTVEFIYDCDTDHFYFLEMNTRIQVEHAVTEMITGIDLVAWQIALAAGTFEPPAQSDIGTDGNAIECRIYAERPEKNFLPSPGQITRVKLPQISDTLRIDTGIREGDKITPYYDPMISKLITMGVDRQAAIEAMSAALDEFEIEGPSTNVDFLRSVFRDPNFRAAPPTTGYIAAGTYK